MKPFTVCALALSAVATPLLAQGGPGGPGGPQPQPRVFLIALDTDRDGQLSAAEIAAAPASLLAALDKNHDGQITPDEYNPHVSQPDPAAATELMQRLMTFDTNKDGVLTSDEMPGRMQAIFLKGDTNKDGKLTADEIRAMAAAQSDPQGRAYGRGNAPANLRTDPIINALDADHDGVMTAAEIAAAPMVLKALDKDGDGSLSAEELKVRPQTPRERAAHSMDEWDGDRDGFLVKGEMPDRVQANFEAMDTNHDGKVDIDELTVWTAAQPMGRGPGGGGPGGAGAPGGPGGLGAPAGPPRQ